MDLIQEQNLPIGVFDSGLGGVSVLRELCHLMPLEDFYYFGDSKNAPYGIREIEDVKQLTIGHVNNFLERGVKGVVVACNTATSAAVRELRLLYPELPLVGIEPAVKPAVEHYPRGKILVMATPMTVRGDKLGHLIHQFGGRAEIATLACPGLMDFVEAGNIDSPEIRGFLRDLLQPYIGNVDAVVLGCTHYPFVKGLISELVGNEVEIIDGGNGTAREMRRRLGEKGLLRDKAPDNSLEKAGKVFYENSNPSAEKEELFWRLLNS